MKEEFLKQKLEARKVQQAYRQLSLPKGRIDFCSNDYLGIVHGHLLASVEPGNGRTWASGSTGSRLLAGNYPLIEETESVIAHFHESPAALIFNSGYDANIGLLSSVPQRGDTILYDYLSHASLRDGIRLSFAQSHAYKHNDLHDLENLLRRSTGNLFVVTESVFSMDGDLCPLADMLNLCGQFGAQLILDEAHATGVIGSRGEGLAQKLQLHRHCFARIHTFGKALGCHGAAVLGSQALKDYLVNFARSFIYTTALPEISVAAIKASYDLFPQLHSQRDILGRLIRFFSQQTCSYTRLQTDTPVQAIIIPGNERIRKVAATLQSAQLDIRPVLYPTVPAGAERLRITLHAYNTEEEISLLFAKLKEQVPAITA